MQWSLCLRLMRHWEKTLKNTDKKKKHYSDENFMNLIINKKYNNAKK